MCVYVQYICVDAGEWKKMTGGVGLTFMELRFQFSECQYACVYMSVAATVYRSEFVEWRV